MTPAPEPEVTGRRLPWTFWAALAPGAAMIAFGVRGVLSATDGTALWSATRWFVGANLVQDLVVSPLVCGVGWVLARWLPPLLRRPVQGALVACGCVAVVAYPLVRGDGITPGEPSFLDRDYTRSVLVLWAATWTVAAVVVAQRWISARRR